MVADHSDSLVHLRTAVNSPLVIIVAQNDAQNPEFAFSAIFIQNIPKRFHVKGISSVGQIQIRVFKRKIDHHNGQQTEGVHDEIMRQQNSCHVADEQNHLITQQPRQFPFLQLLSPVQNQSNRSENIEEKAEIEKIVQLSRMIACVINPENGTVKYT